MRIIHTILGSIILFIDWLTTPRAIKRNSELQALISNQCQDLILYQYKACPFCVKVRRTMKRLALPIELRDPKRNELAKEELVQGSGKLKCPCLKIEDKDNGTQWLFESKEIINYLETRFSNA